MAHALAAEPAYERITVREFLEMNFREAKAELDDGYIRMMGGGGSRHGRLASNIIIALGVRLRGSDCHPYGSDTAVRTRGQTSRYPDVSVYRGAHMPEDRAAKLMGDPVVVFEVLSPSTKVYDARLKLPEYCGLAGVDDVVLVDIDAGRVRHIRRAGPEGWADDVLPPGAGIALTSLRVTLPHAEVFAGI